MSQKSIYYLEGSGKHDYPIKFFPKRNGLLDESLTVAFQCIQTSPISGTDYCNHQINGGDEYGLNGNTYKLNINSFEKYGITPDTDSNTKIRLKIVARLTVYHWERAETVVFIRPLHASCSNFAFR